MYKEKPVLNIVIGAAFVVVIVVAFVAGYAARVGQTVLAENSSVPAKAVVDSEQADVIEQDNADIDFQLFWEVWDEVKSRHVEQNITDQDLFYGALRGVASATGDPYTVFLDPGSTTQFNDTINGEFEGIGAEIGIKDNQLTVIAPLANTPAEQAGLLANDIILAIDETDTIEMSIDEAVALIRGEKGSVVTLRVAREGELELVDVAITRGVIEIPAVAYEVVEQEGKRIGIISMSHFINGTSEQFGEIAQQVLVEQPDGLIIDVRNNPGGLLDEVIDVASQFQAEGVLVSEDRFNGEKVNYSSTGGGLLEDSFETVILINEGSASASEILAGVLQDYDRAIVLGEQSFGKGSVQDYQEFDDGSSLKLTVAKWLTPNGTSINDTGITPDIMVEMTPADYLEDRDPQLDRAIEELVQ